MPPQSLPLHPKVRCVETMKENKEKEKEEKKSI